MTSHSPIIFHYLKKYQDDPTSRVFAPLAEAYRKAGLLDEAEEIAREGLRVHPRFIGGKVALARTLFDKKEYEEVISILEKVVEDVPDNIVAQRLLAESYLILNDGVRALGAFKILLYYSPHDMELAQMVRELESKAYSEGLVRIRKDLDEKKAFDEFSIHDASSAIHSNPSLKRREWVQRVERLQQMLLSVERYKNSRGDSN
ncbi:MAG: hypothetical protein CL678_04400 [Bdellovibrionaceae bacterium]|nr:hypothetical protein [Pseudobdellovibrionaceae bacterium]|tara:strand:+ start:415 stop:1023 length:609 start_codon:yes stop_codon:yes gene_type:complete